jgi:hypothetical protein
LQYWLGSLAAKFNITANYLAAANDAAAEANNSMLQESAAGTEVNSHDVCPIEAVVNSSLKLISLSKNKISFWNRSEAIVQMSEEGKKPFLCIISTLRL